MSLSLVIRCSDLRDFRVHGCELSLGFRAVLSLSSVRLRIVGIAGFGSPHSDAAVVAVGGKNR